MKKIIQLKGRVLFTMLLVFLAFSSCQKNRLETSWDVDMVLPIVHSRLDVGDIFGDTNIVANPDQSLMAVVDYPLIGGLLDSLLKFQDTLTNTKFNIPFSIKLAPGDGLINNLSKTSIEIPGVELSKIITNTTKIEIRMLNTIQRPLEIVYSIPSATKNGNIYTFSSTIPAAPPAGNSISVSTLNLDGYTINLSGIDGSLKNTMEIKTDIRIHKNADSVMVNYTDTVSVFAVLKGMDLLYAQGYFGHQKFEAKDSSKFGLFYSFAGGSFDVEKVNGYLLIKNGLGMDANVCIDYFRAINTNNNTSASLNHSLFGSQINLVRAVKTNNPWFPVVATEKKFDLSNSDIDKMLEIQPDRLSYSMHFNTNPMGNASSGNDFFYKDNELTAVLHLEMPLKFSIDNLVIESKSPINFNDEDRIQSGKLILRCRNYFPFDLKAQMYFLNSNDQIADSLILQDNFIQHGILDNNGIVQNEKLTDIEIKLTPQLLANLRTYKKIKIRVKVATPNTQSYQLYEYYHLDLKLIADAIFEI